MTFEPVAIVGQSCILPGASSPDELWKIVRDRAIRITHAPATRWRADKERMLASGACVTDKGGFVEGFESSLDLGDLDPLFQWLLHAGRDALLDVTPRLRARTGAIVGNLGYPTEALIDIAQAEQMPRVAARKRDPRNRFSTGYPVQLLCEELGLGAGGFALDAACASSLYAIRLACDWLHTRRADCMVAGGISCCDSLLIHSGFTALRALSPTGQSRPFHRDADGLVPAEGVALVVLKRLSDAEAAGDLIAGVIRGVGLSNDGRGGGMLTPAKTGQVRAMRAAYAQAGLSPLDISYVECHATGTSVGDAVELESMAEVFAGASNLSIGSLKANLGHLITASGAAGVIKVLAAMKHGIKPATPNVSTLTAAAADKPFHISGEEEPWEHRRRAAVSSFGFGGNNAHLVLEEYRPGLQYEREYSRKPRIAVVAMAQSNDAEVRLTSAGLVFPPRDLERALPQQTRLLGLAREAIAAIAALPAERTAVLAGIQCDIDACQPTLRLALYDEATDAAQVTGCMPNMAANRVNRQFSFTGPGFAVFGEEESGQKALDIARLWLEEGEIDAAVVGTGPAVLILKREEEAERVLGSHSSDLDSIAARNLTIRRFRAHSVEGLIEVLRNDDSSGEGDHRLALVSKSNQQALDYLNTGGLPSEGIFYHTAPMRGELAFVFTGAAAAYAGMGRDLVETFPQLQQGLRERCPQTDHYSQWIYEPDAPAPSDFQQLCGSSFLSQIHAELSLTMLKLRPDVALGLSSGETNSLYALGAWSDMGALLREIEECGLYTKVLAGEAKAVHESWRSRGVVGTRWAHYRVSATRTNLDTAMRGEPAVHITIINAPEDFVIGGDAEACARVVARLNAARLAMELAVHCVDLLPAAPLWRNLHTRATTRPSGVRFYSNALGHSYEVGEGSVAEALTAQALATVDFPRTVRRAWEDGVRLFVEHGPRNQCTQSIHAILGDLPHGAVSFDVAGRSSLRQALYAAAELWTAGVEVDFRRFVEAKPALREDLIFPAHRTPTVEQRTHRMTPAPMLAPLLEVPVFEAPPAPHTSVAAEMHRRLSESHRTYMEEMTRLQEAFLRTEQNLLAMLAGSQPVKATRTFSRQDLENLAAGRIADTFGPAFAGQDGYQRQVRMPEPPMLLADRVVDLIGEPNSMGQGSIITETDVTADAWYLHQGYMPTGIAIESGQADLLLISWLGADLFNKSERVYRLLGCDLTWHGGLPKTGETLRYEIHVDGHAQSGGIRMFFFHYDCTVNGKPRLSVREGQAGFFSDEDLAASEGVLWSAETGAHTPAATARVEQPVQVTELRAFDSARLKALAEGRLADCFGDGFERAKVHSRSPRIPGGRLQMLHNVTAFDPAGGPWKRGYLRAEWQFSPDDWFFSGHFRNDPCMPGTLMFEGCVQAMAVYLSALGFTLDRDAWRFEPVPEQVYPLRCRGQAVPTSKLLVYEVFVDELVGGSQPALFADVLCTVDGLKAFHCRRMGLRLTPDWPLEERRAELLARPEPKPVATIDGFAYGYHSLLSCALGRPSDAFGKTFARFDGPIRTPRLPAPPYHFMSRITQAAYGPKGVLGSSCIAEYDVPANAWYFKNNAEVMPASVFLEALLQPCGWLASFAGSFLDITDDIFFRNLDGDGKMLGEITPATGTIATSMSLTSFSVLAGMSIYAFQLSCRTGDTPLFEGTAVFGNFPAGALERQAGIPPTDEENDWFRLPRTAEKVDAFVTGSVPMIDRITGYWPERGRMRAEKDLDPGQWFFKAHFFNDPVQPGSLGVEAMIQTLKTLMLRQGLAAGISNPRFEPIGMGERVNWAYRGQVTPANRRITTLVELFETAPGFAKATASLWVDGKKIYFIPSLTMRIVAGDAETLDPERDLWLQDHCPTYTVPALPMMSVIDRLAGAMQRQNPDKVVTEIRDAALKGWISFASGPVQLRTEIEDTTVALYAPERVAEGVVQVAASYPPAPPALAPLEDAVAVPDPYESGDLFHGPAFQVMTQLRRSAAGASFLLNAGVAREVLLDGATHGIPNDRLDLWSERISASVVGFPVRVNWLRFFAAAPTEGPVRCEVRFAGFAPPLFHIQWIHHDAVWATCELVYALVPKGPLGEASGSQRRAFLKNYTFVPGMGIGTFDQGSTMVTSADVAGSDWLPGTLRSAYALSTKSLPTEIAAKQHVARQLAVHPAEIEVAEDIRTATCARFPLLQVSLDVTRELHRTTVRGGSSHIDITPLRSFWAKTSGRADWPIADLNFALIERFIRRVQFAEPVLHDKPVLYLANHQVAVESLLFNTLMPAITGVPIRTIAKKEHRESWIGRFREWAETYPSVRPMKNILFFDREDPAALSNLLTKFGADLMREPVSLMVHAEGTRARSSREPVTRIGSVLLDMAVELGLPVVPVCFRGGLPVEPVPERLEFPVSGGQLDIVIGKAIAAEELRGLPLKERSRVVLEAMDALRDVNEAPLPRSPEWPELAGDPHAVLLETLRLSGTSGKLTAAMFADEFHGLSGAEQKWLVGFRDWLYGSGK